LWSCRDAVKAAAAAAKEITYSIISLVAAKVKGEIIHGWSLM